MRVKVEIIQLKYTAETNCGKGQTIRKVIGEECKIFELHEFFSLTFPLYEWFLRQRMNIF